MNQVKVPNHRVEGVSVNVVLLSRTLIACNERGYLSCTAHENRR